MSRFSIENPFTPSDQPGAPANDPGNGVVRFRFEPGRSPIGWTFIEIWNPFHGQWSIFRDCPGNQRPTLSFMSAERAAVKLAQQYSEHLAGRRVKWGSTDWLCLSDAVGINPPASNLSPNYKIVFDKKTGTPTGIEVPQ